jgi:hypothetical protein
MAAKSGGIGTDVDIGTRARVDVPACKGATFKDDQLITSVL